MDQISIQPSQPSPNDAENFVIRAARPGDCEALSELLNEPGYRWGTLRLPHHSPEEVRKWIEGRAPGDLGLVATLKGRIVGNAGLTRFTGRRSHVASIGMGVDDRHQGRGIGTRLLAELLDYADQWLGLKRIELTVYVDNGPAVALYRKAGFEVEGTHRAYALRGGVLVDAYAMARVRP